MSSLTVFKTNDGIELVINITTGEAFATTRGYARMSGKEPSTISRRLRGVALEHQKTAEVLTPGGLQGVALIPADLVFDWLLEDNKELAKAMGKAGATVYMHQMAGYKVVSNAVEPLTPQTFLEAMELATALLKEKIHLELQVVVLQEVVDELFDYSSIIRIAKLNQITEKSYNWRLLKAASLKLGLEIKVAPCPRYGTKNLYSHSAWMSAYPETKLPETGSGLVAA